MLVIYVQAPSSRCNVRIKINFSRISYHSFTISSPPQLFEKGPKVGLSSAEISESDIFCGCKKCVVPEIGCGYRNL